MGQPAGVAEDEDPAGEPDEPRRRWLALTAIGLLLLILLAVLVFQRPRPVCIAVATSLTGLSAPAGQESLAAMQLAVADANRAGGVDGRTIRLVLFDDQSRADIGRRNVAEIADSGCVAVLGHYLSTVSLAAGPLYRRAHIPALTGTAFADALTRGNPWYFRAQITASMQGRALGEYLLLLNAAPEVELIRSDDVFGRDFARGFAEAYPAGRVALRTFSPNPRTRAETAKRMVAAMRESGEPGVIVIGAGADHIPDVLKAVRRGGFTGSVICAGGAGSAEFIDRFAAEPEERRQPGFFTDRGYATPPLIFDSAGAQAQEFAGRYRLQTHRVPSWIAAGSYDAATIMVEAMRRTNLGHGSGSVEDAREQVRVALAGMNRPQSGVRGLSRTLYFDSQRNMPGPVRMGVFASRRLITHPRQLVPIEHPEAVNIPQETEAGHVLSLGDRHFWLQQVVYTGMDFNRLNRVDLKEGTFDVDLNLWMRFVGTNESPTQIEFPDLLERDAFDPAKPVEANVILLSGSDNRPTMGTRPLEPYNYRLYRIEGDFKATYDLHDYPFDHQELLIRFLNRNQRRELVTYVIDSQALELANSEKRLPSDLSPFRGLQQWRLGGIRYFVESESRSSTLGKPQAAQGSPVEYTGFNVALVLERNFGIFLIKTLVPLLLLVVVVFTTLFLPGNLFRERINIPVTAILTSSVLLLSVNNQLGDVGYTVAIEYIFYAFFALCVTAMLTGITHDALSLEGQEQRAAVLARAGQAFYVTMVLVVISVVWLRYAD